MHRNSLYYCLSLFRMLYQKYHRWGGLENRNVFLSVLEVKSKIKMPGDSVSGASPLPGSQMAVFLLCPHMVEGVRNSLGSLL